MPFSVTAQDEDAVVIRGNTDRQDALDTAVRVANARGCEVVVEDLTTGETQSFFPDSEPGSEPEPKPAPKKKSRAKAK